MEDLEYITLRCVECGDMECSLCPLGSYVPLESLKGCTRLVDANDIAKYLHEKDEVLPFCKTLQDSLPCLDEIENLERKFTNAKLGVLLDARGKAIPKKQSTRKFSG